MRPRLLVGHRTTLVKEATARTARLRDLLTGIHPGLEKAIDPTNTSGLILLTRYITPAEIRRTGPDQARRRCGCVPRPRPQQVAKDAVGPL